MPKAKEERTTQTLAHSLSASPYDPTLRPGAARIQAYPHMTSRATYSGPSQMVPFEPNVYYGHNRAATYSSPNPAEGHDATNLAQAQPDIFWSNANPYGGQYHPYDSSRLGDRNSNFASSSSLGLQAQATAPYPGYITPSPTDASSPAFFDPLLYSPEVAPVQPAPAAAAEATSSVSTGVHLPWSNVTGQDVQINTSSSGAPSSNFGLQTQATAPHPGYLTPSPTDVSGLPFVDPRLFSPEVAPIPPTSTAHPSAGATASTSAGVVLPCRLRGGRCPGFFHMRPNAIHDLVDHLSQSHDIPDNREFKDCTWTECQCDPRASRKGHCEQRQSGHPAHVADLATHIYMTHLNLRFVCDKCGKAEWKSKQSMKRHRDGQQVERRPCPGVAQVRCPGCFQSFNSETLLERHAADTECGKHIG